MVRSAMAAAYSMACTYMVALTPHSWLFDPEPMPPIATMVCARRIATAGSSQPCNGVQFMLWRVSGIVLRDAFGIEDVRGARATATVFGPVLTILHTAFAPGSGSF